jgi:hypothetical protein
MTNYFLVIPAKAGIQPTGYPPIEGWIPAFAGMTGKRGDGASRKIDYEFA